MGITLFTFGGLLASMRSLMDWLMLAPSARSSTPESRAPAVRSAAVRASSSWPAAATSRRQTPRRPLRVVRVLDASNARAGAGRMFMSGRMADVCAELDRLAALEATAG